MTHRFGSEDRLPTLDDDEEAMRQCADDAAEKLEPVETGLIRDLSRTAVEESANRDLQGMLSECSVGDGQRVMLWRVLRRRRWQKASVAMTAFALTSATARGIRR